MINPITAIAICLLITGCATIEVYPPAQKEPMPDYEKPSVLKASYRAVSAVQPVAKQTKAGGGAMGDGTVVVSFQVKDATGKYHFQSMEWYLPSTSGVFTRYVGTGESIAASIVEGETLLARNPADINKYYEWVVTAEMAESINVNFYPDHTPEVFGKQ